MKIKTKHIITCIKCLFLGLVMALPFIAVLPTALYYGFNEHAQDKPYYEIKNEYETHNIQYLNDLQPGIYKLKEEIKDKDLINIENLRCEIILPKFESMITFNFDYQWDITTDGDYLTKGNYNLTLSETNINLYIPDLIDINISDIDYDDWFLHNYEVYAVFDQIAIEEMYYSNTIQNTLFLESDYLGRELYVETEINNLNALEIAFNNVFTTKGFNWVSNSIIATPIYAFVGAFGLTNDLFLSNLIVYWTNILLIYAILNIVIVCFTKLTTLGQKKDKD